jgi:hypothetical protein
MRRTSSKRQPVYRRKPLDHWLALRACISTCNGFSRAAAIRLDILKSLGVAMQAKALPADAVVTPEAVDERLGRRDDFLGRYPPRPDRVAVGAGEKVPLEVEATWPRVQAKDVNHRTGPEERLIAIRGVGEAPMAEVLRVQWKRRRIEEVFEAGKEEAGLAHDGRPTKRSASSTAPCYATRRCGSTSAQIRPTIPLRPTPQASDSTRRKQSSIRLNWHRRRIRLQRPRRAAAAEPAARGKGGPSPSPLLGHSVESSVVVIVRAAGRRPILDRAKTPAP